MRTPSRFLLLGLCSLALLHAGINDGIGGVKIGLGKCPCPPGKINGLATTDSSGTVRFRISEPGIYFIELQNPLGTASVPEGAKAMTVKLQGQASKAVGSKGLGQLKLPTMDRASGLATGNIVMSSDPQRVRLEHPGITFNESGRSHIETIEVTGPTDLMLRLTDATPDAAQPGLQGLPEHLNFVAIEGGPAPTSRDMAAVASVRGITAEWVPGNGATLRVVDASTPQQPNTAIYRVIPTTQSLRAGFYAGNINFRAPDGTLLNETVPVYIRILPRESRLPVLTERHTYWTPAGNAIINVLNPNPVSETIRMENPNARDGWSVQLPPSITLAPGQAMEMRVTMTRTALTSRNETPKELRLVTASGASTPVHLLMPVRSVSAAEASSCRATKLFPMFAQQFPSGANELGENAVVEVRDDCGRVRDDATVKGTDESTAQAKAVKTEGVYVPPSKAVSKGGAGQLLQAWTPPTETEPALEGTAGSLALSGAQVPDLAEDEKPYAIDEVVNASSGEPSAFAPGMRVRIKGCCIIRTPPQISIGGLEASNVQVTDEGDVLFDVPEIPNPSAAQGFTTSKSGIKTIARGAITFAPSSPTVETAGPDGTVRLLKHANLEDPGDDYTANGSAPPQAGDLVSVSVVGLGLATLGDIQIQVNGTPAQALALLCYPGPGTYPDCPNAPRGVQRGSKLYFTMPEVPSGDDSTEGGATIQVMALGVASNVGVTSTIKYTPFPGYFRVITSPPGRTVQVSGNNFTYTPAPPFTFPPPNLFMVPSDGNVALDVIPDKQPGTTGFDRWDFSSWSVGGPKQQTVKVVNGSTIGATFQRMVRVTVTGATVTNKAADDYYPVGSTLTFTPTCPTGQVFDFFEMEGRSLITGLPLGKSNVTNQTNIFNVPVIAVTRCKAGTTAGTVSVTVNTNLGPLAAQVQGLPALEVRQTGTGGSVAMGWPAVIQPVNPGAILLSVNPAQILNTAGNLRYDFVNWTGNGITAPGTQASNQPATMPNAATTYTANFDLLNKVEGTVNGTCTVSPTIGSFIKNGSNVTFNVTPPSALVSATYAPGPGAVLTNLTNGQTFQFVGGTLTVNCGTAAGPTPMNLRTNPLTIGATVGVTGVGTGPNNYNPTIVTPGSYLLVATPGPIVSNRVEYTFDTWKDSANVNVPSTVTPQWGTATVNVSGTALLVYTAFYKITGYQVTLVNNGCPTAAITPTLPTNGILPVGTPVGATNTGTLTNAVFEFTDVNTGQTTSITRTSLAGVAIPLGAPLTVTLNCGATTNVNVTVITNPPNVQAQVGIGTGKTAGLHTASLPASSAQILTADDPFLGTDGNYYRFATWAPSGPNVTLPASGSVTYTANYTLTGYQVDASGCGITVGPTASRISTSPLIFAIGGNLFVNATPPTGQVFQNFTVSPLVGGGATTTYTTNPVNIPFTGPMKIVANCGAPNNVNITLVGNPPAGPLQLVITDGGNSSGPGAGPRTLSIVSGSTTPLSLGADPQFVATGTGYRFANFTPGGLTSNPATVAPKPTTATTYTANYTAACYVLTLDPTPAAGGTATVSPAAGNVAGFPSNCYAPGTNVTLTTQPNTGYGHNSFGGPDIVNTSSPTTTFAMNGPKNVKIFFDTVNNVTLTVATVPPGLDARIGTTGAFAPAPINRSVPANTPQPVAVNSPAVLSGTGYALQSWSNGATTASTQAQVQTANLTMTATFNVACHILTFSGNPASGGTVTASTGGLVTGGFPANCYAPGTTVTLTANPASGQTLSGWTGATAGSGNTATVVMSQPRTVTANFGAATNVAVTVNTSPVGLRVRVDGTEVTTPQVFNWTAGSTHTLTVTTPQAGATGVRHVWQSWSQGGAQTQTITTPNTATTYTANFRTQYLVTTGTNPPFTGDLRVTTNPAPADNYFDAGSTVSFTASGTGNGAFVFGNWQGGITGTANPASLVINAPVTVTAVFERPLAVGGSINNRFPQGTNGYLHRLTVQPNLAVTNMVVTGVQLAVVTGTGAVSNTTSLPINVGTVAANAQSSSMDITATVPTTVTMWTLTLSGTAVANGRTQNWTATWTVQR